jgi:pimeloyl-ACP methyl ester carboxylesterase
MYKYPEYSTLENPQPKETLPNIKKSWVGAWSRRFLTDDNGEVREVENEGTEVTLDWVKYQNTNLKNSVEGDKPHDPNIILMPGYHIPQDAGSMDQLSRFFLAAAEQMDIKNLYSIQTRAEGAPREKMLLEVEIMKQFLLELNLEETILVGFSQGGFKMVKLAAELANKTENVKGLVLINPVGLYQQNPFRLVIGFLKELVTSLVVNKNNSDTARVELDVLGGIVSDWRKSGVHFPKILIDEIVEMSIAHPEISSIKCPVIVIQGSPEAVVDQPKLDECLGAIFENSSKASWSLQKGGYFGIFDDLDPLRGELVNFFSLTRDLPGKSQE